MALLDWLIILGYLGVVFGLAGWVFLRRKNTPDDYFLANRNLGWFIVGASIFASNIGSEHLVGLAGSGATDGVAMAHYELHAWCLLILAWVFVPFFIALPGLHHARVPGEAVLPGIPVGPHGHLPGELRPHQDRCGDLRRGHRLRRPPPGPSDGDRRNGLEQLLDRVGDGHPPHRGSTRWPEGWGRWPTPRPSRP